MNFYNLYDIIIIKFTEEKTMNISRLENLLYISEEQILQIGHTFKNEIIESFEYNGSLKMLRSFLGVPKGNEEGQYIAIDFGGTNLRVFLIELKGNSYNILKKHSYTFITDEYDYTSSDSDDIMLFDFIAEKIGLIIEDNKEYYLGHTFSFGTIQKNINQAMLIKWSKEFKTKGVEGKDINKLLKEALLRKNINKVYPIAIVNDTVTTLLTGALENGDCDVGSICGTGHNTCYLETNTRYVPYPMIINLESGNFNKVPSTIYDEILDCDSAKPGEQKLEKMVSGNYLGKLVGIIINDLINGNALKISNFDYKLFRTSFVTRILEDEEQEVIEYLKSSASIINISSNDYQYLKQVARIVVIRAARIVASTFIGIFEYIDEDLNRNHTIAIDGSLYKKNKLFKETINETLRLVYKGKVERINIVTVDDASGIGAAIAGSIAKSIL